MTYVFFLIERLRVRWTDGQELEVDVARQGRRRPASQGGGEDRGEEHGHGGF